jgi:hypothetical protein
MPHERIDLILKVLGSGLTGAGALILAWRVRSILKWVVYAIVAHEESINQILRVMNNQPQTDPAVKGVPKHLLNYQDKAGFCLLIAGFVSLGVGMLLNMIHFLL